MLHDGAIESLEEQIRRINEKIAILSDVRVFKAYDQWTSLQTLLIASGPLILVGAMLNLEVLVLAGAVLTVYTVLRRLYRNHQFENPTALADMHANSIEALKRKKDKKRGEIQELAQEQERAEEIRKQLG